MKGTGMQCWGVMAGWGLAVWGIGGQAQAQREAQVQGEAEVRFEPRWGEERLELGMPYRMGMDTVVWEEVRFYVSGCGWGERGAGEGAVHLFDVAEPGRERVRCAGEEGKGRCAFMLGVDSATSVAGVMAGDLDPMHGMYWTWQSGYIFMKLEGRCTRSAERGGRFYWHVGGFEGEHAAQRWVDLPVDEEAQGVRMGQGDWVVGMDLRRMAEAIDWEVCSRVMSPGAKATALMEAGHGMFTLEWQQR